MAGHRAGAGAADALCRLGCSRQTFREQLVGVAERYQRRTARLTAQVGGVGRELGGRASVRVLIGLGVAMSRQTAPRVLVRGAVTASLGASGDRG